MFDSTAILVTRGFLRTTVTRGGAKRWSSLDPASLGGTSTPVLMPTWTSFTEEENQTDQTGHWEVCFSLCWTC